MKGFIARVLLVTLIVLVLLALAVPALAAGPSPQAAPTLPDVLKVAISLAILFLVVNGLKELSNLIGRDLSGSSAAIAAALTAVVLFAIDTFLELAVTINPGLVPWISAVFQVLVTLLGAMGVKRMTRGRALVR